VALRASSASDRLRRAVLAYVVVLVAMAAQAFARWREHPSPVTQAAAIGAALFVVSDAVLAIDRFHARVPVASLWILVTYWLAQWGIAQSVRETPPTADAPLPGAAPSDAPRREAVSPAAHPQSTGRERMR
jgi:hypothetical protein